MHFNLLLQLSGLLAVALVAAVFALWLMAYTKSRTAAPKSGFMTDPNAAATFLFEDLTLIDATESARQLLAVKSDAHSDWDKLLSVVAPRHPEFETEVQHLPELGQIEYSAAGGASTLVAQWQNGLVRVVLNDRGINQENVAINPDEYRSMQQEIETLRTIAQAAPFLVWRQDESGQITWANNAYLELADQANPDRAAPTWPPARLFVPSNLKSMDGAPKSQRVTTYIPGETEPRWFEYFETSMTDGRLYTAVSADKIVTAEQSLRSFVQTLTKTFADLKIGLAIFDKHRRLALFNPALSDLTSLSASFLSSRPTLQAVLDKLRDNRMLPEQRDYKSWRQQLFELETAAQIGTYEETWALSTGQTYRVTGHPHPDGALAFLMEDISAEISLTRRFRMELETSQSVLDSLGEAVAVFSPSGTLTLSNTHYARLWGVEPSETIGNSDIIAATRCWSNKCAPSPVWGDAREFVGASGERAEWVADVRLSDGRNISCRFVPLSGGSTLAAFSLAHGSVFPKIEDAFDATPPALDKING